MTTPVDTDDIVQGAVKWLEQFPDVLDVLGSFTEDPTVPYLFQHKLYQVMEGSQSTAAVVLNGGGWAGPNTHNSMRFPRIILELTVDPLRAADQNVIDPGEAYRRINRAYEVIDRRLHRPQGGQQQWGDIRTIGCSRQGEPTIFPISQADGALRLQVFYGVTQA